MVRKVCFFVFVSVIMVTTSGRRIPSFAGPYRAVTTAFTSESTEYNHTGKFTIKAYCTHPRGKEQQYLWGSTHLAIPIDHTVRSEVRISQWSNNQWKNNAFVMKFPNACEATLKHAKFMMGLLFGEDGKKGCPATPGDRIISNRTVDIFFPQVPVFPYGRWLFTILPYRGSELIGVISIEGEVVPKL